MIRRMLLAFALLWTMNASAMSADDSVIVKVAQIDPTGFPRVTAYVSVTDAAGQPMKNLTKDDVSVTEDDQPAEVLEVAGATRDRPVDIVFVFDTTGSMREEIEGVKETAIAFAEKLEANRRDYQLGLVAFGDEIRLVRDHNDRLTGDAEEFKGWIGQLAADGGDDDPEIALDGLQRATEMKYRSRTQKVLILITDAPPHIEGDGTRFSKIVSEEQNQWLADHGFTVYAVAYNDQRFRQVVEATGGDFYDIHREPDFTGIIDKIGGVIANQYRVTYLSPRASHDGTRRHVLVIIGDGSGSGAYVEKHVMNIESSGLATTLFLLPLLLALILPSLANWRSRKAQITPDIPGRDSGTAPTLSPGPNRISSPVTGLCPRCGQSLRPGARFCAGCGQPVHSQPAPIQPAVCPHCSQLLRPAARFCANCGLKVLQ